MPDNRILGGWSEGGGAMMTQWTMDRTGNSQNVASTLLLSVFRDNNIISSRKVP